MGTLLEALGCSCIGVVRCWREELCLPTSSGSRYHGHGREKGLPHATALNTVRNFNKVWWSFGNISQCNVGRAQIHSLQEIDIAVQHIRNLILSNRKYSQNVIIITLIADVVYDPKIASWLNKTATRLAEAMWLSVVPDPAVDLEWSMGPCATHRITAGRPWESCVAVGGY